MLGMLWKGLGAFWNRRKVWVPRGMFPAPQYQSPAVLCVSLNKTNPSEV